MLKNDEDLDSIILSLREELSLESSIHYQGSDSFFPDLTAIYSKVRNGIKSGDLRTNVDIFRKYGDDIENLIKKRFNLNVKIAWELSNISFMAIIPFMTDTINSIPLGDSNLTANIDTLLKDRMFERAIKAHGGSGEASMSAIYGKLKSIMKTARDESRKISGKKGIIDYKRAIVSGYHSEVSHHLIINPLILLGGDILTPEEMAATTIHEIGHAFHGLESHYRMTRTNEAIAETLRAINNNELDKARYTFNTKFGQDAITKEMISEDSDRNDFYGKILTYYMEELESNYQYSGYDATTFEYQADNFAVRMGAGDHLVTALDNLYTKLSYNIHKNPLKYRAIYVTNILLIILLWWALLGPGVATFVTLFYGMIYTISGVMDAYMDDIYDSFKDRPKRIAQDIAHILKDRNLPKPEKEALISQYEVAMISYKDNKDYVMVASSIFSKIIPSIRKKRKYKELQKRIEESLNNPLFVNSAKYDIIKE